MKKGFKFLTLFIILVICLLGCEKSENKSYLEAIDYATFNQKLENKDSFILEVVQTGCPNCTSFTPKFTEVLEEYKIKAYSMNLTNMSEEDNKTFLNDYDVDGTPTLMFFEQGTETSTMKRLEGDKNKDIIISKLKQNGYIK